jgi:hypothetical protein
VARDGVGLLDAIEEESCTEGADLSFEAALADDREERIGLDPSFPVRHARDRRAAFVDQREDPLCVGVVEHRPRFERLPHRRPGDHVIVVCFLRVERALVLHRERRALQLFAEAIDFLDRLREHGRERSFGFRLHHHLPGHRDRTTNAEKVEPDDLGVELHATSVASRSVKSGQRPSARTS